MSSDLDSFHEYLRKSKRILAVCGAGLGASSGLPTFRGAGGMWRQHNAMELATPEAFRNHPGLVWQFYSLRRHYALQAKPNAAHYALAELARRRPNPQFLTLSQNVDGLSNTAGHPGKSIEYMHGSLFRVRCMRSWCRYERDDVMDPITPALKVDEGDVERTVGTDELPRCPECKTGLLRPAVIWFGENLDPQTLKRINQYLSRPYQDPVDLCIVIGTSGTVFPTAGYAGKVKEMGGKVAVVDIDCSVRPEQAKDENFADWLFEGDAAELVPKMLYPIIGDLQIPETPPGNVNSKCCD
ncbi:Similar to NAD-dependent protein deacylase; acc. no. Q5AI90 [Pyronema omphalodes CBS 100304]|uniref:Similar to NAD-dependent protein deacylase acc. no. Q5AI90 n=1 Tax=Pyronema omphalodes (strain CBS 100304) TaxID=1076935 RepID=U4LHJ0_PYROM|nr:Similar to NAD-dependent protein deacylase; acc. no. Q5AI90 [Pyronema omphalodes CBS 100304]